MTKDELEQRCHYLEQENIRLVQEAGYSDNRLRSFCAGLEMQKIDDLMEGTVGRFYRVGQTMAEAIKDLANENIRLWSALEDIRENEIMHLLTNRENLKHDPHPLVDDIIKWARDPDRWQWQSRPHDGWGWQSCPADQALFWFRYEHFDTRLIPKEDDT